MNEPTFVIIYCIFPNNDTVFFYLYICIGFLLKKSIILIIINNERVHDCAIL